MRTFKVVLFAVAGVIAGGLLFKNGLQAFRETRQLQGEGVSSEAKAVDERTGYRGKGRAHRYLTVDFRTPSGESVTKEIEVDYDTHSQGAANGQVIVHYLPTDPTILRAGPTVTTEYGNLLLGAFMVGCSIVSVLFIKQPKTRKELAEDTSRSLEALSDSDQKYVPVDGRTFRGVDQKFYDAAQRDFESQGFAFLEDIEVIPSRPVKGFTRTFARLMLSSDRTQVANIFHVKPGFLLRMIGAKEARVYGVDTQMTDNSFVCTDTAESCNALNGPPDINSSHLPSDSTVETVLSTHNSRVETHSVFRARAVPVKLHSSDDVVESMILQNQIKAAYRQQAGLSKEELERLAGAKDNEVVNNLHADLEHQRENSRREAA